MPPPPADRRRQRTRIKRLCQRSGDVVIDDVDQAASAEGHHGVAAGVRFGSHLSEGFLAGGNHHHIGGGIEQAEGEKARKIRR